MRFLQVVGESPEKTANCVANPEDGVDQHGLVVFLTDPIILGGKDGWKKKVFFFKSTNLTGDRVEDVAMVVVPALVTQLVRTTLHQTYHIVPDYKSSKTSLTEESPHLIAVNWSGSVSWRLSDEK